MRKPTDVGQTEPAEKLKKLIFEIIPYLETVQDEGPAGEGWKSDTLTNILDRAYKAVDAKTEPDQLTDNEKVARTWKLTLEALGYSDQEFSVDSNQVNETLAILSTMCAMFLSTAEDEMMEAWFERVRIIRRNGIADRGVVEVTRQ
jgi:hypothetical protein